MNSPERPWVVAGASQRTPSDARCLSAPGRSSRLLKFPSGLRKDGELSKLELGFFSCLFWFSSFCCCWDFFGWLVVSFGFSLFPSLPLFPFSFPLSFPFPSLSIVFILFQTTGSETALKHNFSQNKQQKMGGKEKIVHKISALWGILRRVGPVGFQGLILPARIWFLGWELPNPTGIN